MKTISMVDFRLHSEGVVRQLRRGENLTLSYRGRPLARLVPIRQKQIVAEDDPFYRFYERADPKLKPMTNEEMDRAIYGRA